MSAPDLREIRRTLLRELSEEFGVPLSRVRGTYSRLNEDERNKVIDNQIDEFDLERPESESVYENLRELRFLATYICNDWKREIEYRLTIS